MRGRVVEFVAWWMLLTLLYVALITTADLAEVCVAVGAGLLGALTAVATRTAERVGYRPRLRWLAWLAPLPVATAGDTLRLTRLLALALAGRRTDGDFGTVHLPVTGWDERDAAHRALGGLLLSVAPGSYVVTGDPDTGEGVMHRMGSGRGTLEERVSR